MLANISFYISAPHLREQEQLLLKTAIKLLAQDGKNIRVLDDHTANAHLLVLDEDSQKGKEILANCSDRQAKLLFSSRAASRKNIIALQKPVDIPTLKSLLERLFLKLQEQIARRQTSETTTSSDRQHKTSGSKTIFNVLLDAREQKKVVRISYPPHPDMYVDGLNESLVTTAPAEIINEIIKTSLDKLQVECMPGSGFAVHNSAMNISTLHNILWMAGLECSEGRLLRGHDLNTPVKLKAWPNFTRNSFKPEHLKLAASIARQSMTLTDLSESTGVDLREVVNFYNAAYAVNLIEKGGAAPEISRPQKKLAQNHQSLFTKIANRLSLWG